MNWHKTDLADIIAAIQSGSRPKGGVTTDTGEVMSLGGENILQQGGVELRDVKRVPHQFYATMTKGHLRDRDVLINKDGANTGKVGLFRDPGDGPACINEHLFLLRGDESKITQEYLYYTLLSECGQTIIRNRISGSAQPGLKSGFINNFSIELPEFTDEQEKIGEIIGTLDRAIEQTEALIAKQQRIKTGLMQDLLTMGIDEHGNIRSEATHAFKDSPLGRIPVEWDALPLSKLVDEQITYGIVQAGPHQEVGVPYIRTGDMSGDKINRAQLFCTTSAIAKAYKRSEVQPGDIVFALRATVGKVLSITNDLAGANLTQGTAKISPSNDVDSAFLLWALRTEAVLRSIQLVQKGTTFAEITLSDLRQIKIALPSSLGEQQQIARDLNACFDLLNRYSEQSEKLQSLKRGLMHDLLTGKRRVTELLNAEDFNR
jgi:type I restriction enzyme S subunit